jgi:integrase
MGDTSRGITEDLGRSGDRNSTSSYMERQALVSSADKDVDSRSDTFSAEGRPAGSATFGEASPQLGDAAATSLAAIRQTLVNQGFSEEVANRVARNVRGSSLAIYDNKWKIFVKYCQSKDRDPVKVDLQFVADFFNWLFTEKKLTVSTIKGYRTAIGRVLIKINGLDLSQGDIVRDLITNFGIHRPVKERILPKWDLSIVLNRLQGPPYEPLVSASITHVTWKTAFLILLASGARRGEVHALEYNTIIKAQDGKSWIVKPDPKFVAKNHVLSTGKGEFKGIKLYKLKALAKDDQINDSLCPVRMLNWYLHKTSARRGQHRQLFITCNRTGLVKPAHKNTLSAWIKKLIADAYQAAGSEVSSLVHRSTHEIRAVAASYAAFSNVSIEEILMECRWAQPSTFAKYYLRRVSGDSQGFKVLLPLQMAGAIIQH